ncbi:MAG TPA: gephyrin-like molybdotransferase Glp [Geminicoccaceae bacterium]|nr:gephyrin-like molybdotransferase Glp [Geminicoccaceae bacterium]
MAENLWTPAAVRRLLLDHVRPLSPRPVPLSRASGLVLAEDLSTPADLPRFASSAMDGFAVRAADTTPAPVRLQVLGRALAGRPFAGGVAAGTAVAIATGAAVPTGADAVAPVEIVEIDGGTVIIDRAVEPGRHVRAAGEDLLAGTLVLPAGTVLGPGQLAAAAAMGRDQLMAHPRPMVSVLPTGDEVRSPGAALGPGQVHDAVSAPLGALLAEVGAVADLRPVAPDDQAALAEAIHAAAGTADLILTIGGISVGERDLVRQLGGTIDLTPIQVALRPGRPFAFGRVAGVLLCGLPGNPAAALASFEELVRPVVLGLQGKPPALRPTVLATLTAPIKLRPGRLHLVHCRIWWEAGRLRAQPLVGRGTSSFSAMAAGNALAVIPADATDAPAGAEVAVRPLTEPPPVHADPPPA